MAFGEGELDPGCGDLLARSDGWDPGWDIWSAVEAIDLGGTGEIVLNA